MKRAKKKPTRKRAAPKKRKVAKRRAPSRRRGLMLVLSSPSGAGKTTLTRMLLEDEKDNVELSSRHDGPKRESGSKAATTTIDRKKFDDMDTMVAVEWARARKARDARAPGSNACVAARSSVRYDGQGRCSFTSRAKRRVRVACSRIGDELHSRLARRRKTSAIIRNACATPWKSSIMHGTTRSS